MNANRFASSRFATVSFAVIFAAMWKGRFQQETAPLVQRFTESVSFDCRLYKADIQGSLAHAAALERAGLLSSEERKQIEDGLHHIEREIDAGHFMFKPELEDIHMNIESALTDRIGSAGAKLHTARSRNDQVALDLRLYLREQTEKVRGLIRNLQQALVNLASLNQDVVFPGYTHLQRAQPVAFSHYLLAYVHMFDRDADRLSDCRKRLNEMPLGSGAIAGSTIPLDRAYVAELLGFSELTRNSMDAVSDRDFVAETLFAVALCGVHLSRLSEDLILYASAEFGFIRISDAFTTGSSLMPQKKNPDVCELTRGKTGRLIGNLVAVLTVLKAIPMTYNRDLQEDKEALFDSLDQITLVLQVYAQMIPGIEIVRERTLAAAQDPMLLATDLADYLVRHGIPFRQAHEAVGRLVALSLRENRSLKQLTLDEFRSVSECFDADVLEVLQLERSLETRTAVGAPARKNVAAELEAWNAKLRG
jgi:argininosuccinate lyase